MILPAIYIIIHLVTVILCFNKKNWLLKYKNKFIVAHFVTLLFLLIDIFVINLKGVLVDRLIVIFYLISASMIFAFYRHTLKTWQKLYFGFFLFYPIVAAITFLIDGIMFIVVASPLLLTLTIPEIKFTSNGYELREVVGSILPVQLSLVKKGILTEKHFGVSNDEQIINKKITTLTIVRVSGDTTIALVKTDEKNFEIAFKK